MPNCVQCSKPVNKRSPGLQCVRCSLIVHAKSECSGLTGKQLNAIKATESLEWTCVDCSKMKRQGSLVVPDDEDDEEEDTLNHSKNIVAVNSEKITAQITKQIDRMLNRELSEITRAVQHLSDKVDECLESTEAFKTIIKDLEKKNLDLKNKNIHLENRFNALEQRMNENEQKQLANKVEIIGVPQKEEENLQSIMSTIATALTMNKDDVKIAERQPSRVGKPGIILMAMKDSDSKTKWISAAKEKRLNSSVMPGGGSTQEKIFVREALTQYNKNLLWKTKQQLKEKFKYVWCKNGKIMARKNDKSKMVIIRSEVDIYDALHLNKT